MEDNYIQFTFNNRSLKINKNDSNNILIWCDRKSIKSYWRNLTICLDKDKRYLHINVNRRQFRHHRVVYFAHNQNWDINLEPLNNQIDHIDENKHNNHISNLRLGTNSLNKQNQKKVKGYYWDKSCNKYRAKIAINGKTIHLGIYEKEEQAHQAYLDAKKIYHKW